MTVVIDELAKVQKLAAADAAGDEKAHGELLKGIRTLLLAAETPLETTSRLNFQVRATSCHHTLVPPSEMVPPMTTSFTHDGQSHDGQSMPATRNSNINFRSCKTSAFGSR